MKRSKEYKISVVSSGLALVLFCISLVTGLIPGLVYSVDKICFGLGFACLGLGLIYMKKSKEYSSNEEN